jgi:hypothetical protein
MFLLLHAGPPGLLFLIVIPFWLISTFLVIRGIYRLKNAENKLRLIIYSLVLLLICGFLNQFLYIFSDILFPFLEGMGTFVFPFGLFFGLPALFFFDTRDVFVYKILVLFGAGFNLMALINLAYFIERKVFKNDISDRPRNNPNDPRKVPPQNRKSTKLNSQAQ